MLTDAVFRNDTLKVQKVARTKSREVARLFAEKMEENVARRKSRGRKSREDLKSQNSKKY